MIEVIDLNVNSNDQKILEGINLSIKKNEFIGIIGPSGCGKSTLINCLSGVARFKTNLLVEGQVLISDDLNLGHLFQDLALFPHFNVEQNITYPLKRKKKQLIESEFLKLLDKFKIKNKRKSSIHNLSGGERQRVALARELISNPDILFLDEPLTGLDNNLKEDLFQILLELKQDREKTIILVSHNINDVFEICDRIIVLSNGKLQQIDTPNNIYTKPVNVLVASYINSLTIVDVKNDKLIMKDAEIAYLGIRGPFADYKIIENKLELKKVITSENSIISLVASLKYRFFRDGIFYWKAFSLGNRFSLDVLDKNDNLTVNQEIIVRLNMDELLFFDKSKKII